MSACLRRDSFGARGGFTLLELLVVMTIIAIAFFAVRPNFTRAVQADRERATLRQVAALFTSARAEAVAQGRLVRITVLQRTELRPEIQALPPDPTGPPAAEDYRTQFDSASLLGRSRLRLPDYVAISQFFIGGLEAGSEDEQMIYFYPDGRTSGASLLLTGATGQEYLIEVSPTTGKVVIRV